MKHTIRLISFAIFALLLVTGVYSYAVGTKNVIFVDDSRIDPFSTTAENRKLTVQFWYPAAEEGSDTFPLLVFSHGSFGFRGSNLSTFEDLASNGYVVCSIDHSYHSFFTKHTDGSTTLVNMDFLNDAVSITNGAYDQQTTYKKTHEWLELRTSDMNFVLDEIVTNTSVEISESVFSIINSDKIAGHLNFTDLPLFSPTLARMLGTGDVDSRYCIETMNHITLEFFNSKLKDAGDLHLQTEY